MEFRLFYDGPLKANGNPSAKHAIRKIVHAQLRELVSRNAMSHFKEMIEKRKEWATFLPVGPYEFVPLISEKLTHVAELHITFLTPEEPGRLVTQGGDLDNRLKTLLDALRCPKNIGELPANCTPTADETPFLCLLEDDALISALSITTDRLLRSPENPSNVVLLIQVIPRSISTTLGTTIWVS
jgi:hypothetical protein